LHKDPLKRGVYFIQIIETIAKKIRKAKTDPDGLPSEVAGLEDRPEARNLVNIYAALNDMTNEQVVAEYAGAGWGKFKPALADLAVEKLAPISTEMQRFMNDPAEIDRIMAKGAAKAKAIADPILDKTFDIMGFVR